MSTQDELNNTSANNGGQESVSSWTDDISVVKAEAAGSKNEKKLKTPREKKVKEPKIKKSKVKKEKGPKVSKLEYIKSMRIFRRYVIMSVATIILIVLSYEFISAFSVSAADNDGVYITYTDEEFEAMALRNEERRAKVIESYKTESSDIIGMTKYDKYEMGLLTSDDSDSDADGLTDREEIEIYGSDPRKYSTAGDLYSDKQKVDMGIDPSVYTEYKGDYVYPNCTCPEVILSATSAKNLNAVVSDVTGSVLDDIDAAVVLKHYEVWTYEGRISIDLSLLNPEVYGKVSTDDVLVYWGRWGVHELEKASFDVRGSVITPDIYMSNGIIYEIYLVEKDTVSSFLGITPSTISSSSSADRLRENASVEGLSAFGLDDLIDGMSFNTTAETEEVSVNRDPGFVCYVGIGNTTVYYSDLAYVNSSIQENLTLLAKKLHGGDIEFVRVSKADLLDRRARYNDYLDILHFNVRTATIGENFEFSSTLWYITCWFDYYDYCDVVGIAPIEMRPEASDKVINFDVTKDGFSFKNAAVKLNEMDEPIRGCCEGFSVITAKVFNNGGLSPMKNVNGGGGVLGDYNSYDLTKNKSTSTFGNRGVHDYKPNFVYSTYKKEDGNATRCIDESMQSKSDDIEVLRALTCYQFYGNDVDVDWDQGWDVNDIQPQDEMEAALFDYLPNGELIDKLVRYLDSGKIAIIGLPLFSFGPYPGDEPIGNHAMNIVGYEKVSDGKYKDIEGSYSGAEYIFYLYDSNHVDNYRNLYVHEMIYNGVSYFVYELDNGVTPEPNQDKSTLLGYFSDNYRANNMASFSTELDKKVAQKYKCFFISDENLVSLYEY